MMRIKRVPAAPISRSAFQSDYRDAVGRGFAVGVTDRVLQHIVKPSNNRR